MTCFPYGNQIFVKLALNFILEGICLRTQVKKIIIIIMIKFVISLKITKVVVIIIIH